MLFQYGHARISILDTFGRTGMMVVMMVTAVGILVYHSPLKSHVMGSQIHSLYAGQLFKGQQFKAFLQ